MTFDDGILKIYETENSAPPGFEPVERLAFLAGYYYRQETLGYGRYYTALQARQKVDMVVSVPGWEYILANHICIPEDSQQYTVQLVQKAYDENGLKITRLTLERLGREDYAIKDT